MKKFLVFLLATVGAFAASSPDVGLRPSTSWAANNIMDETGPAGVRNNIGSVKIINMVTDYGADNTGATDISTVLTSAIAAANAGDTLYFPKGLYKQSASVQFTKSLKLKGDGIDVTTISNSQASGQPLFLWNSVAGAATNLPALNVQTAITADSYTGDSLVSVASTNGFVAGGVYVLWDNDQEAGAGRYRAETVRVLYTTNSTQVVIDGGLARNHLVSASAKFSNVLQNAFTIEDMTIDGNFDTQGSYALYSAYTYGSTIRRVKFPRLGNNLGAFSFDAGTTITDCEIIGSGNSAPNQGYAFSFSSCARPIVQRTIFRNLQWQMWTHVTGGIARDNIGYGAGTVSLHGYNSRCVVKDSIHYPGVSAMANAASLFNADNGVGNFMINCGTVRSAITGFYVDTETNFVMLNCWVKGSERTASSGEPETTSSSGATVLLDMNGFTIRGLNGSGVTGGITLTACSGNAIIDGVKMQLSASSSALVKPVTTTSTCHLIMRNCHSDQRLYDEPSTSIGVGTLTIENCSSDLSPDVALFGTARATQAKYIIKIDGTFGSYAKNVPANRYSMTHGVFQRTPADGNTEAFPTGAYTNILAPGRLMHKSVYFSGYSTRSSAQVAVTLPHDVPWLCAGQRMIVINGDATTGGSTTPTLPIKENGIGTVFTFPTGTQNSWVELEYAGMTNYWTGTSNWRIVDADSTLGVYRKRGTMTIAADGTVTNTFTIPFQSGVTPIVVLTPTVNPGGINYFVTSSDNTMFKATGPIGVTFNWTASNGDH